MTINATAIILLAMYVAVGEAAGRPAGSALGHGPERHSQGVRRPRHVHLSAAPVAPDRDRHHSRSASARCRSGTRFRSAVTTSGRPDRPRFRRSRSRWRTRSRTSRPPIDAGLDVNALGQRLSFFFNVHNNFLEEVAKFRAARRLWARHHARPIRRHAIHARSSYDSTRRRRAARSRRSSPTTTSCGSPFRRWRRSSAARSRCTAMAATRRWPADRGERHNRAADAADPPSRKRRREHRRSGRRRLRHRGKDHRGSSERPRQLLGRIDNAGGTLAAIESGLIQRQIQDVGLSRAASARSAAPTSSSASIGSMTRRCSVD